MSLRELGRGWADTSIRVNWSCSRPSFRTCCVLSRRQRTWDSPTTEPFWKRNFVTAWSYCNPARRIQKPGKRSTPRPGLRAWWCWEVKVPIPVSAARDDRFGWSRSMNPSSSPISNGNSIGNFSATCDWMVQNQTACDALACWVRAT